MQKCRLGQTDITVSKIGLGTVKFGRNEGVKYPHDFVLPTPSECAALIDCAKELGINFLDTAPAYGNSEALLGELLIGQRQDWVISTKVGETFIAGKSYFDFSATAIINSIERSLQRLRTDYLDIVLVHSNGEDIKLIEAEKVFATLATLKQSGKICSFGMSSKTLDGGIRAIDESDVAMVTYHPSYTDEVAVIAHAQQKQKGILIKKALASGHFTKSALPEIMSFILKTAGVSSVVVGTINCQHLKEIAACVDAA